MQNDKEEGRNVVVAAILLAAVTLCTYLPLLNNGFISFDDDLYVTDNSHVKDGLSWSGLSWALGASVGGNWHPVTWLSHMTDVSLFGMNPAGHHFSNLLLHVLNTLLLFGLLRYATGRLWAGEFVAALFALHPLHVESVAWASERKDVLSTFFLLATIWAYFAYVRRPGTWRYIAVLLLYALGLMSKPMLVTLPIVLLMLDYWPLERTGTKAGKLLLEKLPLLLMAIADGLITILSQSGILAVTKLEELDLPSRLTNAIVSYWRYAREMLWPAGLSVYYPLQFRPLYVEAAATLLAMVIVTVAVLRIGRRYRYLPVGWFWYIVTLIPVLGIVQVGHQSHADRYTYVPLMGLFIMIAYGAADILTARPKLQKVVVVVGIAIIAVSSVMTWRSVGYWKDDLTLFRRSVVVTKDNYFMLTCLATALNNSGDTDEAIARAEESVKLRPVFAQGQMVLGALLQDKGKLHEALEHCSKGAELDPHSKGPQLDVAMVLMKLGRFSEAEPWCRKAISIDSEWATGYDLLGLIMAGMGKLDQAEAYLRKAISLDPAATDSYGKLAMVLELADRKSEAIEVVRKGLVIDPQNAALKASLNELSGK